MCDHCPCQTFPAIADLTTEHEVILERAWTAATDDQADLTQLRDLLDRHVAKEETGLYPALLTAEAIAQDEIVSLEDEHEEIHTMLHEGHFDRRAYFALAAHIEVEEMHLFPAAWLHFTDDEWDATDAAHRVVDAEALRA